MLFSRNASVQIAALWLFLGHSWVSASAQSLVSFRTQPEVLTPGGPSNFRLEIKAIGSPSKVTFESALQPGVEVMMKDDGTGGDVVAGDGVYTISLASAPVLAAMTADDVYRPFIGYARPYNGSTAAGRYNQFAEVSDGQLPSFAATTDAADVQHTDYVVNIRMPQAFPSDSNPTVIPNQSVVTNRFFQLFPDGYDFIDIIYTPSFYQNRFHYAVRNAIQGIGLQIFNSGQQYGSAARLLGISVFPITNFFDAADPSSQHETGHQWINFLNVPPLSSGIPHWPLSTMAFGTMGFSISGGEGGRFPCRIVPDGAGIRLNPDFTQPVFNDLDLYLMGLLPPDQVAEQIVLDNQDFNSVFSQCNGSLYGGTFTRLHVSDLIGNPAIGPRIPNSTAAQKNFRTAVIVVSRDALLSPDAMSFYSFFAQRAELQTAVAIHNGLEKGVAQPFALSTRGLGSMTTRLRPRDRDFNGDGRSDILWRNTNSGGVIEWFINGTAVIGSGSPGTAAAPWTIVGSGDFNGDGNSDILWLNTATGDAVIWLMNGTTVIGTGSPGAAVAPWSVQGIGDFNGDGRSDILWRNSTTGDAVIWLINGTARIGTGSPGAAVAPWTIAGVGDFNGDSRFDILWRNTTTGDVVEWLLNGAAVIGVGSPGGAVAPWTVAGIGDFNGDGRSDILWRNTTSGALVEWLLNGITVLSTNSPGALTTDWVVARMGDYNADGKSDILWRNSVSGTLLEWLLNAGTVLSTGSPGGATLDWQVQ